jgi:hypothetical protein
MTKQAMGNLVNQCEAWGLIERRNRDGRVMRRAEAGGLYGGRFGMVGRFSNWQ